jgi:hypothetical protein
MRTGKGDVVSCGFMRNTKALLVAITLFGMTAEAAAQLSGVENSSNFFLNSPNSSK